MNEQKPAAHSQEFEFDATAPQQVRLRTPGATGGNWLTCGPLRDISVEYVEVSESAAFGTPGKVDVCRRVLVDNWWSQQRLGWIAELTHQRLFPDTWRVLAPNVVCHHAFGPGVTVATDGIHVLLFDSPTAPSVWLEVHRENVVGPVTSTPTALREWDGTAVGRKPSAAAALRQRILDSL